MTKQGIDVLLIVGRDGSDERGNHRYLTDYGIVAAYPHFVVMGLDEAIDPIVFTASPSAVRSLQSGWVTDRRRNYRPDDEMLGEIAKLRQGGLIGVMDTVPIRLYQKLVAIYGADAIVDGDECLKVPRMVRSAEEIACARKSADIADQTYARLEEIVRPGITDFEIYGEAQKFIHALGSEYSMDIIDTGDQVAGAPVGRVLAEDAVLHIELSPAVEGYFTQLRFGIPALRSGWDEPGLARLRKGWELAFTSARDMLIPGSKAADVYQAAADAASAEGYKMGGRIGHGLGLDVDEYISLDPGDNQLIAAGMTIVVHPPVVDGKLWLMMGGTFLVTDRGPEPLNKPPFA